MTSSPIGMRSTLGTANPTDGVFDKQKRGVVSNPYGSSNFRNATGKANGAITPKS